MEGKEFWKRTEFWVVFLFSVLELLAQNGTVDIKGSATVVALAVAYIIGRSLVKAARAFRGTENIAEEVVDALEEVAEVTKEEPIIKSEKVIVEDPDVDDEEEEKEKKE